MILSPLTQFLTSIKAGANYLSNCLLIAVMIFCSSACQDGNNTESTFLVEAETPASLWKAHPDRLRTLFNAINLQGDGLSPVRDLLNQGDTVKAAGELATYFRNVDRDWVLTSLEALPANEALTMADMLLTDSVMIHEVKAKVPLTDDGGWEWSYTGPIGDDEFGYSLNGQSYLTALFTSWENSGNSAYIRTFDKIIKDWVIHHPVPAKDDSIYVVLDPTKSIDWRDIGEVEWRTLEAGRRLGATWPQMFYAFHKEEEFTSSGILLMLSSMVEQSEYLFEYHKSGHNWTTMEMNGLSLTGLAFPEFKRADEWANYALEVMTGEINRQVYPDGIQTELSTKTQWVALRRFESVAENFRKANREISQAYLKRIEEMYNYLAYCMRPDGHQPLNSDSDRENLRERVLIAAEKFNRPDWKWIATNGKEGSMPETGPSVTFPWAGIHISRSGWDQDAHWSFFDFGSYGTGHQHRDKLHLSVSAFGKDLLVDGGRFTHQDYFSFDPKIWRGYFRSSFSHNVILVDGHGQNEGPTRMESPLVENVDYLHHPKYDYAYGTFDNGFEEVDGQQLTHSRSVVYLRDKYWVVLDHLVTDQPRDIQVLWHFAPGEVIFEGKEALSANEGAPDLRIVPIGNLSWETELIEGQEEPFIQGWYSENYGTKVPNPAAIYSSGISQSSTFGWVLVPGEETVPKIQTTYRENAGTVTLTVTTDNETTNFTLPVKKEIGKVKVIF